MSKKNILNYVYKYKKELRFVCVGMLSTSIDFIIYILLSKNLDIIISKLISTVLACVISLIINKNWTFEYNNGINISLILKYSFSQIVNIVFNVTINTMIYRLTNMKSVAFILATGLAMFLNFTLQKVFVFKVNNKK
ncbi:GtrA family protein [Clostridium neonatale]|uniref:GtrA family protein n=1 Tax=Clostridium neonatale TaxID=137838 RepID=UPI00291BC7A8|nr:GtrA domain-containing protein [Clostridium neonatale]